MKKFAALLSLLICVCLSLLWARSYPASGAIYRAAWGNLHHDPDGDSYDFINERFFLAMKGHVIYCWDQGNLPEGVNPDFSHPSGTAWGRALGAPQLTALNLRVISRGSWKKLGLTYYWGQHGGSGSPKGVADWTYLAIPIWYLIGTTALFPLVVLLSLVRRRRSRKHQLCPKCGYDLRATPLRCPECGYIPAENIASASA